MQVQTHITKSDLIEFQLFESMREPKARAWRLVWALVPPVVAFAGLMKLTLHWTSGPPRFINTLGPSLLILPLYLLLFYSITRRYQLKKLEKSQAAGTNLLKEGDSVVVLAEEGVQVAGTAGNRFYPWEQIPRVLANGDYLYLYPQAGAPIIVPGHCFGDDHAFRTAVKMAVIFQCDRERSAAMVETDEPTRHDRAHLAAAEHAM